jgi:hypothetical protein
MGWIDTMASLDRIRIASNGEDVYYQAKARKVWCGQAGQSCRPEPSTVTSTAAGVGYAFRAGPDMASSLTLREPDTAGGEAARPVRGRRAVGLAVGASLLVLTRRRLHYCT